MSLGVGNASQVPLVWESTHPCRQPPGRGRPTPVDRGGSLPQSQCGSRGPQCHSLGCQTSECYHAGNVWAAIPIERSVALRTQLWRHLLRIEANGIEHALQRDVTPDVRFHNHP